MYTFIYMYFALLDFKLRKAIFTKREGGTILNRVKMVDLCYYQVVSAELFSWITCMETVELLNRSSISTSAFLCTYQYIDCVVGYSTKVRSKYTTIALRCRYIDYISTASHCSITTFQVKMNRTSCDTAHCNNIA